MIYITGDTHGTNDISKLFPSAWPEGQRLTRNDYLVILGDFGALWGEAKDGQLRLSNRDRTILSWYEDQPWTTLFVDGNHENHDFIDQLPATEMFGGKVQPVPDYPHVIHLMRGEIYDLPISERESVRCLAMGGAMSLDREWRVEGESWWAREMPSNEEYARCTANLERAGWSVDYVLTHEVPYNAKIDAMMWNYALQRRDPPRDELSGYLQWIDDKLDKTRLKMWFSGHYHLDRQVMDDAHRVVFEEIIPLEQPCR